MIYTVVKHNHFMKGLNVTTTKFKAIVLEDKITKGVIIYLEEKGGPIISAPTLEEAKAKFEEALNLGCAVRNLHYYNDAVFADGEQRKALTNKMDKYAPEIEFVSLSAC